MSFLGLTDQLFETCLDVFGEQVCYLPKSGGCIFIHGLFRNQYVLVNEGSSDTTVSSSSPVLEVQAKELLGTPTNHDKFIVRDEHYKIVEIKPNDVGQITFVLKKV